MSTRPKVSVLVSEAAKARESAREAARELESHEYLGSVNAAMRSIERVMADIAPTEIPVLLIGESGTGKDIVAVQLHQNSLRRGQSFRKILSSSASPDMLSSAALNREPGTLFLDEITELSTESQARLLQSLVEAENSSKPSPARLVCASTRNIEELMRAGRFREELYFRLNGVCLRLPPLRHRSEDVPALAEFFLTKYARMFERAKPVLSAQSLDAIAEHTWPGNVRELENAMKKTVILGEDASQLAEHNGGPARPAGRTTAVSLKEAARAASRQAERELILQALARTRWNRKRAAVELQISYKALLYKLKQISPEEFAG